MFTLIARPRFSPEVLDTLPTRVGASIAGVLTEELGLACEIKHPNDILVGGRKLCGILCTSRVVADHVAWLLCGVGINTCMSVADLPTPLATSLSIEGAVVPSHQELLAALLPALEWLRAG